jgi:hypothetical protein
LERHRTVELFPAVFDQNAVDPEFAFTPFRILNGIFWLSKPGVDRIFEMVILRNLFNIARADYKVIDQAARCMQQVYYCRGIEREDIKIDFDLLFPILMICVFVFGVDEWMQVTMYAMSFNEYAEDDDVELKFGMTYLEGLVIHILPLNCEDLRKKAAKQKRTWIDQQPDPLGVS